MCVAREHHPYHRDSSRDGSDSLSLLSKRIAPGSRVLDVGAGQGMLGQLLTDCQIDGVDVSSYAFEKAQDYYRNYYVADLNESGSLNRISDGEYDYVVCADVLEHLYHPESILEQAKKKLKPDGKLLVSLPNVTYAGVISELLLDRFDYRETGILDSTHLHFYTKNSALEMIADSGFWVSFIESVVLDIRSTEFSGVDIHTFPSALRKAILGRPNALAYQFVFEACIGSKPRESVPDTPLMLHDPSLHFYIEVFWRGEGEIFDASRSSSKFAKLEEDFQTIDLPIRVGQQGVCQIRLDPADRLGNVSVYFVELLDSQEELLWSWDLDKIEECHDVSLFRLRDRVQILSEGLDPQVVFQEIDQVNVENSLCILRVGLSWPKSKDYYAISHSFKKRQEELEDSINHMKRHSLLLQDRIASLESELREAEGIGFLDYIKHNFKNRMKKIRSKLVVKMRKDS